MRVEAASIPKDGRVTMQPTYGACGMPLRAAHSSREPARHEGSEAGRALRAARSVASERGRLHTGVCASAARTSRRSAHAIICQQTSPLKIAGTSAFQWSFPILTGLLCEVITPNRTRINSSEITQWRNRVIFFFRLDRVRRSLWAGNRGRVWVTVPSTYMESSPWWSQCSILNRRILWCSIIHGKYSILCEIVKLYVSAGGDSMALLSFISVVFC